MTTNQVVGTYDAWTMVVVYDPKTGEIMHMHQAISTRGGAHPDANALEQLAAEHAAMTGNRSIAGMAFLHVSPGDMDSDGHYSVDVAKKSLVRTNRRKIAA